MSEIFEELNENGVGPLEENGVDSVVFCARDLVKIYNNISTALDGLSITVRKGDIYGIIGENGSGKTTLMRIAAGLVNPNGGSFTLFGANGGTKEADDARKRISGVIERPHAYIGMTAKDNLIVQCMQKGVDPSVADTLLEQVGLTGANGTLKKVKQFSLGMFQRLGIALALVGNPEFIMLDEPMNGLDPIAIIDMRNLILDLNSRGITFLISSHILSELSKVATKYGFIRGGKMIKEVDASEIANEDLEKYYLKITGRGVFDV